MKRTTSVMTVVFAFLSAVMNAQTAVSGYLPGVTTEGAVYFLPKTAIRITVQTERTTYTPGDFCKYSERYLRLKDVPAEPAVAFRLTAIRQEAFAVADTAKAFSVKFDARTSACNVRLSDDGILLAINTEPLQLTAPQHFAPATRPAAVNPRQYMSEEILAAGSTAKMAELTAQDIYEIRESRNLLIRGQADYMPKDGDQLRLMLSQLEQQDLALTSLFTGTTVRDTAEYTFIIVPDKDILQQVVFRFSGKLGVVDVDDLAGTPYYISIKDLQTVPPATLTDPKRKQKQVNGIYVNVPGRLRSTISNAQGDITSDDFPAAQFGNVELLSGALFNKRYTTHLRLNPLSGAVEKLEAEQPK